MRLVKDAICFGRKTGGAPNVRIWTLRRTTPRYLELRIKVKYVNETSQIISYLLHTDVPQTCCPVSSNLARPPADVT